MQAGNYRKTYRHWDPEAYRQQAHSPDAKLPDGDLVFFLLDVVSLLDLSAIYGHYERQLEGAPPFDPRMMTCLLLYAYCVGVFSSRKIELACQRNLAFLAIAGDLQPDFRTISGFRKTHLDALAGLFTQVLRLAREAGLVQLGAWATDGSKFPGNASRHKAMSYSYILKEEERLELEIAELLRQMQQIDEQEDPSLGTRLDELGEEWRFRDERMAKILQAKQRLEEQARAEAQAQAENKDKDKGDGGSQPERQAEPLDVVPDGKAQTNFTDPELKIMPQNNKGWEYSGNAQVVVDDACQIIVAAEVVVESNDKRQAVAMAQKALENLESAGIERPLDGNGEVKKIAGLNDSGYYSEEAVSGLEKLGIDPYVATGRQKHHEEGKTQTKATKATSDGQSGAKQKKGEAASEAKQKMSEKLKTAVGKAVYALRKGVVEPVFGQIKGARGFRRFSLRGLKNIRGEWSLVCLTHNLLKLWRYRCAPVGNLG